MEIKIIKSNRKTLSLSVDDDMCAVVKAPYFVTNREINAFVSKNKAWLENAIERKKKKFEKYDVSDDEKNKLINLAQKLAPMVCFDYYSKEPSKMNFDMTYNRSHDPNDMVKAYISAVGRGKAKLPPPKDAFSGIVSRKIVSVSSKIITVMRKLYKGKTVKYSSLFEAAEGRSDLVATFLAVLELVKGKRVRVEGDGDNPEK